VGCGCRSPAQPERQRPTPVFSHRDVKRSAAASASIGPRKSARQTAYKPARRNLTRAYVVVTRPCQSVTFVRPARQPCRDAPALRSGVVGAAAGGIRTGNAQRVDSRNGAWHHVTNRFQRPRSQRRGYAAASVARCPAVRRRSPPGCRECVGAGVTSQQRCFASHTSQSRVRRLRAAHKYSSDN